MAVPASLPRLSPHKKYPAYPASLSQLALLALYVVGWLDEGTGDGSWLFMSFACLIWGDIELNNDVFG